MDTSVTTILTGQLPFLLVNAALLSLPVSLALLWWYRRAVIRSMMRRGDTSANGAAASRAVAPSVRPDTEPPTGIDVEFSVVGNNAGERSVPSSKLLRRAKRGVRVSAAIYTLAGSVFAAVMTMAFFISRDMEFSSLLTSTVFWLHFWVVVVTIYLVLPGRRPAAWAAVSYFLLYAILAAICISLSEALTSAQVVSLWRITNGPVTLLLLLFLHRRIRAVGPLVLVLLLVSMTGAHLAVALFGSSDAGMRAAIKIANVIGLGGKAFYVTWLAGFAVFVLPGLALLAWLARRYQAKRVGDQALMVDATVLLFAVVYSVDLALEGWLWIFSGAVAFAAYKATTRIGFSLWSRSIRDAANARLLVLRVFSLGARSERLFADVSGYWRHIGSIQMIAGPDLVNSNIEPDEFLDFVAGRLGRRFIDNEETLQRRFAEMDTTPDVYSRYRVNEFFCHDNTWRAVLRRLVGSADAVLMDLRGFTAANLGCAYEIGELVDLAPLARVLFVTDQTTDMALLEKILRDAGRRIHPASVHRTSGAPQVNILCLAGGGREIKRLVEAACNAVGKGAEGTAAPLRDSAVAMANA